MFVVLVESEKLSGESSFCTLLILMANSKYEYVKSFEEEDEVMLPNLIIVRIEGRDFRRYCIISIT